MDVTAFPQRKEWAVVHALAVVAREAGSFVKHGECPGLLGKGPMLKSREHNSFFFLLWSLQQQLVSATKVVLLASEYLSSISGKACKLVNFLE